MIFPFLLALLQFATDPVKTLEDVPSRTLLEFRFGGEKKLSAFVQVPDRGRVILFEAPEKDNKNVSVSLKGPYILRDVRIVQVTVTSKDPLRENIRVELEYGSGTGRNEKWLSRRYPSPDFERLYRKLIVNYRPSIPHPVAGSRDEGARFLIISPEDFVENLEDFIDWKTKKGYPVRVATLSETGTGLDEIKAYIQNAYETWDPPPEYVLLVGDENIIPTQVVYDPGGCGTYMPLDVYYAQLEGNDYLADVFLSRFPAQTAEDVRVMVKKSLLIDRPDSLEDLSWFKKAVFMAGDIYEPDTLYADPKRQIADAMGACGFLVIDTLYTLEGQPYPSSAQAIEALEDGRLYQNFRGNAGGMLYPPFEDVDADNVFNWGKPSILFMVSCDLASFTHGQPHYSEKWLLAGSPDSLRGGAAYVGSSGCVISQIPGNFQHTLMRNSVDVNSYLSFLADSLYLLQQAVEAGRLEMLHEFPGAGEWRRYHYEEFTTLGDPTLNLWSDIPCPIEVAFPSVMPDTASGIQVEVRENGFPMGSALVSLSQDQFFSYGYTDASGVAYLPLTGINPGFLYLTASGKNLLPYSDSLVVYDVDNAFLAPLSFNLADTLNGNGNGQADRGEILEISVPLFNYGSQTASDIQGRLSTTSEYLEPVNPQVSYGTAAPGDTIAPVSPFKMRVADLLPDRSSANLHFTLFDSSGDTWQYSYTLILHTSCPRLDSVRAFASGGNCVIEPGDTATVRIYISNPCSSPMDDVYAYLMTNSPYVILIDTAAYIRDIESYGNGDNAEEPFEYYIVENAPDTTVDFTVRLQWNPDQSETLTFQDYIGGWDYLIWDPSPQHEAGAAIKTALDSLGLQGHYTEELTNYRNVLCKYHALFVTLGSPPQNYYLAEDEDVEAIDAFLDLGGNLYIEGGRFMSSSPSLSLYSYLGFEKQGFSSPPYVVEGIEGSFASGLHFSYGAGALSVDHLQPSEPTAGELLLGIRNSLNFTVACYNDTPGYKIVGSSVEFVRFDNPEPPEVKLVYMEKITQFFGLNVDVAEGQKKPAVRPEIEILGPNPSGGMLSLRLSLPEREKVTLKLYNESGRAIKVLFRGYMYAGVHTHTFSLSGQSGRPLPSGVYFLVSRIGSVIQHSRLVILK